MYRDILIATDDTDAAHEATKHGLAIAQQFDATVHVLSVYPDAPKASRQRDRLRTDVTEEAQRAVNRVEATAREANVDCVTEVRPGVPHETIVDWADESAVDMIVMGTHGREGFDHLLSGSVAEEVIRNAPVPVVTVRGSE